MSKLTEKDDLASLLASFNSMKIGTSKTEVMESLPTMAPPGGITGKWVRLGELFQKKSFGYFKCNYCQKEWMSAHAQKGFKQGCKGCNRYFHPQFMWLNEPTYGASYKKSTMDINKPHLKSLCEACSKGKCDLAFI